MVSVLIKTLSTPLVTKYLDEKAIVICTEDILYFLISLSPYLHLSIYICVCVLGGV